MDSQTKHILLHGFGNFDFSVSRPCALAKAQKIDQLAQMINESDSYSEFMLKAVINGFGKKWIPGEKMFDVVKSTKMKYGYGFGNWPNADELKDEFWQTYTDEYGRHFEPEPHWKTERQWNHGRDPVPAWAAADIERAQREKMLAKQIDRRRRRRTGR